MKIQWVLLTNYHSGCQDSSLHSYVQNRSEPNQWWLDFELLYSEYAIGNSSVGRFLFGRPDWFGRGAEGDGASRKQTFFRIVASIPLPAYASVAINVFTQVWNAFFLALALSSRYTQPVQAVMAESQRDDASFVSYTDGCNFDDHFCVPAFLPFSQPLFCLRYFCGCSRGRGMSLSCKEMDAKPPQLPFCNFGGFASIFVYRYIS